MYARIPRNIGIKFGVQALRGCIVGYLQTGFILYVPEERKFYETRHVKVVESTVYKDIAKTENKENEKDNIFEITADKSENTNAESIEKLPSLESEGELGEPPTKRKRGRPKKNNIETGVYYTMIEKLENIEIDVPKSDFAYHALLAGILGDLTTYREAMNSPEGEKWREAVQKELIALKNKQVYSVVEKGEVYKKGEISESRKIYN